jgi:hypothetical protein
MRLRLIIAARSLLIGWVALFAVTYLTERPLLHFAAPLLGGSWFPTADLALQCVALTATGWVIGRWNRLDAMPTVIVFGAMLAVWDFGLVPAINIRWLFQLIADVFESSRYLESLITAAMTHVLLFGSLVAGVRLSRPQRNAPVSLVGG